MSNVIRTTEIMDVIYKFGPEDIHHSRTNHSHLFFKCKQIHNEVVFKISLIRNTFYIRNPKEKTKFLNMGVVISEVQLRDLIRSAININRTH